MKIRNGRTIRFLLMFFCLLLVTGCDGSRSVPNSKAEQQKLIKELESQAGFVLSDDVELLETFDGSRRDASHEYYCWSLYSPTAITTMPIMKEPYINGYLKRSLNNVEFFQEMAGTRKIKQPQSAFSSDWEENGYEFQGSVLRTSQGDYMVIQRFRIRRPPPGSPTVENPQPSRKDADNQGK